MWSPGPFSPGTPVSAHSKTIETQKTVLLRKIFGKFDNLHFCHCKINSLNFTAGGGWTGIPTVRSGHYTGTSRAQTGTGC